MTKEELKQEAEDYANNLLFVYETDVVQRIVRERVKLALIDFAEPREKRIAELEQKLEQTEKDLADYQFNYPTIKELQKENAELKGLKDVATLIRANNDTVTTLMQLNNMLVGKNQQLTKAKELLTRFVMASVYFNGKEADLVEEAEQFLKEE